MVADSHAHRMAAKLLSANEWLVSNGSRQWEGQKREWGFSVWEEELGMRRQERVDPVAIVQTGS